MHSEREDTMSSSMQPSSREWALLSHVVREVTRSRAMPAADAEDFEQTVLLKVVERDFDVFERFHGRSSLKTYLRVVVSRMLLDWQNHTYGKWRPSATAMRLGEHAIALERLISRDHCGVDEAVAIVAMRPDAPCASTLRDIADRLPRRLTARKMFAKSLSSAPFLEFEDPVHTYERERAEARIRAMLAAAVGQLSSDDRQLITLRYDQERSVRDVASLLKIDAKALYRRYDRVLRSLRKTLAERGVTHLSLADVH